MPVIIPRGGMCSGSRCERAEAFVVVAGVVPVLGVLGVLAAGDDTPGAAVVRARRGHGVLPVVAGVLVRQDPLPVLEPHAVVARVVERPAGEDVVDDLVHLRRQLARVAGRYAVRPHLRGGSGTRRGGGGSVGG